MGGAQLAAITPGRGLGSSRGLVRIHLLSAPHVMSGTAAIALILPAAPDPPATAIGDRLAAGGGRALLASAAAIRFQYLPAIGALVIASCLSTRAGAGFPCCLAASRASCLGLCRSGDGGVPFAWIFENFRQNIVENRAAGFSSSGPFGYVGEVWPRLRLWAIPLLAGPRWRAALSGPGVEARVNSPSTRPSPTKNTASSC